MARALKLATIGRNDATKGDFAMKLLPILATLVVVGLTSTPAFALFCANEGPEVGFDVEVTNSHGSFLRKDSQLQKEMDLQRLRSVGVDANSVERWNGCLQAFVRTASGGESMEFYDPATLRRLQ
jgi:hypothetical protein